MPSLRSLVSFKRFARLAVLGSVALSLAPSAARAQGINTFQACTQGSIANCAVIQLISGTNAGTNFFEILIRNLGSQTTPSLATSINNLVFETGSAPGAGNDISIVPQPIGATLTDNSAWDLFDSGDFIFLSALSNNGVGGCAASGPVNIGGTLFGQAGQTCDPNSYFAFKFATSVLYNPLDFQLADMEVAGLTSNAALQGDTCGYDTCTISSVTPEPSSIVLAATGFMALVGLRMRRRRSV